MIHCLIPLALSATLAVPAPAPSSGKGVTPPPGMVLVPGGRTKIGTPTKEIEKLLEENANLRQNANPLVGETPQYTTDVAEFFMMVNEVTNEQYLAFVEATGHRPPQHWGRDAIDAATAAFLQEQGRLRKEAKDRGEEPAASQAFDQPRWWQENWDKSEWQVPEGESVMPVVYVDFRDAVAYCRWAGLRLPTEEEYQRACRGDGTSRYPWGDEWHDTKYCASNHLKRLRGLPQVIGCFPEGNSPLGITDLAGNVWEWTSSKFVPFPGYKMQKWKFGKGKGKEKINAMAAFDPNKRVVVGGSVQTSWIAARCTTRRGAERYQQTNSLGFRAASSGRVGLDIATTLVDEIPNETRPRDLEGAVSYAVRNAIVWDRWTWKDSAATSESIVGDGAETPAPKTGIPPQYSILTGYEHIAFVPVEAVQARQLSEVRETSLQTGPVHLGLLSITAPTQEPVLAAGAYFVALRGAGETEEPKETAEAEEGAAPLPVQEPVEKVLTIDITKDNFVFYDLTGKPVAARPVGVGEIVWGNVVPGESEVAQVPVLIMEGEEEVEIIQTWYKIKTSLPGRGARKGVKTTLALRFENESIVEGDWRKNK